MYFFTPIPLQASTLEECKHHDAFLVQAKTPEPEDA
jgi:hypothetical protein